MSSMYSPQDILFWIHHAFIDYTWSIHQLTYDPKGQDYSSRRDQCSLNDAIPSFSGSTIVEVMNSDSLCIAYLKSDICYQNLMEPLVLDSNNNILASYTQSSEILKNGKCKTPPYVAPVEPKANECQLPIPLSDLWCQNNVVNVSIVRTMESKASDTYQKIAAKQYAASSSAAIISVSNVFWTFGLTSLGALLLL